MLTNILTFATLLSPEARAFLRDHATDDPVRLLMQAGRFPGLPLRELAAQLAARQRVAAKLPTWVAHESVLFPPTLSLEQSSSERTARYKAGLVSGGILADLTGGLGVDAWAFAQTMQRVVYVEKNTDLVRLAAHNLPALGAANVLVENRESEIFLNGTSETFDWLYLDPARRDDRGKVFRLENCEPDVLMLRAGLLEKAPRVLVKAAPLLDLDAAIRQLETVETVHVLAVDNEVKELLFTLTRTAVQAPEIRAVNLLKSGQEQVFGFYRNEETQAEVVYSSPLRYLYEPNAALLKAGAFRLLAGRFGVSKLHVNSHLYTSEVLRADFPGRIFSVKAVCKPDRKALQTLLPNRRAHLTVRNFPASVADLRKRLGLADGGEDYVFATSLPDGQHVLVLTTKTQP
ncbi:MAG: SAM-dependent methyltransferase [Sphingobacteriaceae bacterium]|nr:SAM-dependent methyltransferase [Cytophagaceae bacterium]